LVSARGIVRFLDLELEDPVTDATTIGCFAGRWRKLG
jgi:hypothetical protein